VIARTHSQVRPYVRYSEEGPIGIDPEEEARDEGEKESSRKQRRVRHVVHVGLITSRLWMPGILSAQVARAWVDDQYRTVPPGQQFSRYDLLWNGEIRFKGIQ